MSMSVTTAWPHPIMDSRLVTQPLVFYFRALSKLFIKVAYGDVLSRRDTDELVVANTEAQRRVGEAFIQLWLVNFIPWSQLLDLSEIGRAHV